MAGALGAENANNPLPFGERAAGTGLAIAVGLNSPQEQKMTLFDALLSSVPEPETLALLLAGLMMVLVLNRRRFGD